MEKKGLGRILEVTKNWLQPRNNANASALPDWVKNYNRYRDKSLHHTACRAPFTNMLFSQDGSVKVCCHNNEHIVGKYPKQSIWEIWNSERANQLRVYMEKYDLGQGCKVCELDFRAGNFSGVAARHFDGLPMHSSYPVMMEFLLSNQCNLECVMCTGEYSNLIRKNREKLPALQFPYDEDFLTELKEFIPHLTETRFSGSGEPFSIEMNYRIWEMIIELNPTCIIMVQTNGTILTERVKKILAKGNFRIGVSIDSLKKELYESIRLNANFEKVMQNTKWFSEYSLSTQSEFIIAMCVMQQNCSEMPLFVEYANSLNARINFHKVWNLKDYSLQEWDATRLNEMYEKLLSYSPPNRNEIEKSNALQYNYFINVIKGWAKNVYQRNEPTDRISDMKLEELKEYLEERIKKLLNETGDQYGSLESYLMALTEFENQIETEEEKIKVWQKLAVVPVYQILKAVDIYPASSLKEYAYRQLGKL